MTAAVSAARWRRRRVPLFGALAVGCVVALLIAVLATAKSADQLQNEAASPLLSKQAPEISGSGLDGGTGRLSSYRGRWVLVNFFASWCVPCQQEQGDLVQFQNNHAAANDAAVFGVRFDDPDTGPIRDLMSQSGGRWVIVDDPNAKIDYGVTGPPESFLVDPSGTILAHVVGKISAPRLEQLVSHYKLLELAPPASSATTTHP